MRIAHVPQFIKKISRIVEHSYPYMTNPKPKMGEKYTMLHSRRQNNPTQKGCSARTSPTLITSSSLLFSSAGKYAFALPTPFSQIVFAIRM